MPTYVYECKTCLKGFEIEQRITADPLSDCECGGNLRRVIQPVGISFKGAGFYVNDVNSKSAAKTETKPAEEGHAPVPAPIPAPAPATETKSD